jgi:hypothetical protein
VEAACYPPTVSQSRVSVFPVARRLSVSLLLLALVATAASCGRTSHEESQPPLPSGGAAPSTPPNGGAGAAQAGSVTASGGAITDVSFAGAPEIVDPAVTSRPCLDRDVPGAACEDPRCWGTRCGVRFDLACEGGAWSSGGSSLAWELSCPAGDEPINDIGELETGACCGKLLPKNDVHTEPNSCSLCPDAAPDDGAACSLPDDCATPIIDCFYRCCCYGDTVWAQCDGKRWHVATNCSPK